jgi:hypothetical protein
VEGLIREKPHASTSHNVAYSTYEWRSLSIIEHSITVSTVNNHLQSIFKKLGCSNRTEAVMIAIEKGIVSISD